MMYAVMLSPQRVISVFSDCLLQEGGDRSKEVLAYGIVITVSFDSERLESHREEIETLLDELPDEFMQSKGGGMSFLHACKNKRGRMWTGMHVVVDQLFTLGIAIGKVEFCSPRDTWHLLPGGVPYLVIK
jgi:hypothetical protein